MNADEILKTLRECGDCDTCSYYSCWIDEQTGDPADACDEGRLFRDIIALIESLQAQLAKEKRRADRAVEDLETAESCITCEHDWDCEYSNSNGCSIANYKWRGDAEEGDAE